MVVNYRKKSIKLRGGQWMIKKETIGEEGGDKLYKEDS